MWDSDDELLDCQIEHFLGANFAAGELDSDDDATEQTTTEEVGEAESVDEADVKVVWCEGVFTCLGRYVQGTSNVNPGASRLFKVAYNLRRETSQLIRGASQLL